MVLVLLIATWGCGAPEDEPSPTATRPYQDPAAVSKDSNASVQVHI